MRPKEKMNMVGVNILRQLPGIGPVVGKSVVGEENRFETLKIEGEPVGGIGLRINQI